MYEEGATDLNFKEKSYSLNTIFIVKKVFFSITYSKNFLLVKINNICENVLVSALFYLNWEHDCVYGWTEMDGWIWPVPWLRLY